MPKSLTAQDIDALLPQTQCGLCNFKGCMPYAEALATGEASINLCPPGGVTGLHRLGHALGIDPSPFVAEMEQKAKPAMRAVIREAECIGCTKCIQACPVDAIVGSSKAMHSVLFDECTGCELCVLPCPVDCIDMIKTEQIKDRAHHYRTRYLNREKRLRKEKSDVPVIPSTKTAIQDYLQAALLRTQSK